jgi:threonine dehydrogenase-like Zn-dependent dehydrogenase
MSFPTWTLKDVETAACFFCAGFLGANAEAFIRDAGVKEALCIDYDGEKLAEMRKLYPASWTFVEADAYRMLDELHGRRFDLVTADPQLDQMGDCFALLPKFRALGKTLVMGCADPDAALEAGAVSFTERTDVSFWGVWHG